MGLVILIIVGALLGWLGSIVVQREHRTGILVLVFAGIAGAIVGGLLEGGVPLLTGIAASQILWAMLGSTMAIAIAHLLAVNLGDGAYR